MVQGIGPLYQKGDYGDREDDMSVSVPANVVRLPLYDAVATNAFTDGEVRSRAGNTMPIPMIGAALAFVLGCTDRV